MISHYYALEKECSKAVVHISFLFFSPTLAFSLTLYEILQIPKHIFTVLVKEKKKKKKHQDAVKLRLKKRLKIF